MTSNINDKPLVAYLHGNSVQDQRAHALSNIFERPLRIAKSVDAITPDIQADISDAGRLAMSLLRASLSSAPDRLKVMHAVDGLGADDRSECYTANTENVFLQVLDQSSLDAPMAIKAFRAPDFVAALPIASRKLRQNAGSNITALPPNLAGAFLPDAGRMLLSANMGIREHYIAAQCMTTVHLIEYLSANGIDAAQGDVLARVHRSMFGQEFTGITDSRSFAGLPIHQVLDQGKVRKAQGLEFA